MESVLPKHGVTNVPSNAPSSDIMRGLSDIDLTRLKAVREELFLTSKELNLTDSRDVLVNRKDTVVNPIRKKIIDDIIRLDRCIKNRDKLPRTLLKGGKRSGEDLEDTRCKNPQSLPVQVLPSIDIQSCYTVNSARDVETDTPTPSSATVLNCSPSSVPILIVQQMNSLQNRMDDINRRLTSLQAGLDDKNNAIIATLNREIEMLKARVQELFLLNAPTRPNCDIICSGQKAESSPSPVHKPLSDSSSSLNVVTWNCRGLNTADPYLSELAATNDIIVIQEHWLWPHSLCKLDKLLDGFLAYGCSDKRLTENSDPSLKRGCGGVAILWKKRLPAMPISAIQSDRIIGIQLPIDNSTSLTIIGVYLPSSDHPTAEYMDYLVDLESIVSSLQANGPVLVVGDFNAHLGNLGCARNHDVTNQVGQMLFDVIDRCDLYAVSQSVLASGECYTFAQGHYRTTVDYCLIDPGYAHLIDSCTTLSPAALNFSDHLPISISLNITTGQMSETDVSKRLNWQLAIEKETVKDYSVGVSVFLSEVLTRPVPLDDKSLDREIAEVSHFLCSAAQEMIPVIREKKKKSFYRDEDLKQKSKENKAAWRLWVDAGRPREGRVYDSMKAAKL